MITSLEKTLLQVAAFMKKQKIPYMVIGGVANLFWGNPRTTQDIDVTILVPQTALGEVIVKIASKFSVLVKDPKVFVEQTRVLPIKSNDGVRVDIIFALLPYEEQAIKRAKNVKINAVSVKICCAEDLILYKIISERQRDLDDVKQIIAMQGRSLNFKYLKPLVSALAYEMGRPEIEKFFLKCIKDIT